MRILFGINKVTHRSRYMKRVGTKAQGLELQSSFLRHVQERKAQFKKGETQCFVSISLLQFVRPLLLSGLRLRPPPPRPGVTKMCPRLWYPRTTYQSRVPAVKVTYSYRAPSDESGSAWSTFDVYFREDEISPRVRRALSTGKISRSAAAELFEISTVRGSTQQLVLDETNSILCEGYYVDGSWVHTNQSCEDRVTYRKVASP